MRCPGCGHNQRRGKEGMICTRCRRRFAFDPKGGDGITDHAFLRAVDRASAGGSMAFTLRQLGASLAKRGPGMPLAGRVIVVILGLGLLVGAAALFVLAFPLPGVPFGLVITIFGVALLTGGLRSGRRLPPGRPAKLAKKWSKLHGSIDRLIAEPALHEPPPQWPEADIYDYGVERVLIVDRDELVDLVVLNRTHVEMRGLAVSMTGYPAYAAVLAGEYIAERPDLPVLLLHGESTDPEEMVATAEKVLGVPLVGRTIDLGIRPGSISPRSRLRWSNKKRDAQPDDLAPARFHDVVAAAAVAGTPLAAVLAERAGSGGDGGGDDFG